MLMMLLLTMLSGAGDARRFDRDDVRAVKRHVEETVRRNAVLDAMDAANALLASLRTATAESVDALAAVDAAPDTTARDYQEVLDAAWQVNSGTADAYIDIVFQMRSRMSRDEWSAAFGE